VRSDNITVSQSVSQSAVPNSDRTVEIMCLTVSKKFVVHLVFQPADTGSSVSVR
jgi:hypothetical protein